jgi:hypothetical protein
MEHFEQRRIMLSQSRCAHAYFQPISHLLHLRRKTDEDVHDKRGDCDEDPKIGIRNDERLPLYELVGL